MEKNAVLIDDIETLLTNEEIEEYLKIYGSQTEWLQCTLGLTKSVFPTIVKLSLAAISKRLLVLLHTKGIISASLCNLSIAASGLLILYTQNDLFAHICAYAILIGILPYFNKFISNFGYFALTYAVGTLLLWQLLFTPEDFMSMRGVLMIMLMKISSLSFDLSNGNCDNMPLLTLLSYLLDGSTIAFGPWITFQQHKNSLSVKSAKMELLNIFYATSYIMLSLVFLVYSSCIADSYTDIAYIGSYFTAQSFRFSHYFVSWLSAGASTLSGSDTSIVANWLSIEWPRSLVDVVVSWNIPMHNFLHRYVFAEVRQFGTALAIFITYAVSSLLHGFNFQLSAVLLSLGFYTYAETRIRSRLSYSLGLCIRTKKCAHCQHKRKDKKFVTYTVNTLFRILAMIHLIYLGMIFDNSSAEVGYSWEHTVSIWSKSYFYSHIIGVVTLLVSFAV